MDIQSAINVTWGMPKTSTPSKSKIKKVIEPIQFDVELVKKFIERFGKEMIVQPLTRKAIKKGKNGDCFYNAKRNAVRYKDIYYVEGLAGNFEDPTLHGWNKIISWNGMDRYVDTTWPYKALLKMPYYIGVEFDVHFSMMTKIVQQELYGNRPGGYATLTYEPLLLGKIEPYIF